VNWCILQKASDIRAFPVYKPIETAFIVSLSARVSGLIYNLETQNRTNFLSENITNISIEG